MAEVDFTQVLINAGVLGAVVVMLYRILTNELRDLRDAVKENTKAMNELVAEIRELKATISRLNYREMS
jgi:cell division protein FtsB